MGNRRKARELTLQFLFQIEFSHQKLKDTLESFWQENVVVEEVHEFATKLIEGTLRNLKEIDQVIEEVSTNWKLPRMAAVDRNLLRQTSYELLYLTDIPASVSINEAVDIAKKFGTEESPSFINGILDKIGERKKS
jgi:N utilization substance protein B